MTKTAQPSIAFPTAKHLLDQGADRTLIQRRRESSNYYFFLNHLTARDDIADFLYAQSAHVLDSIAHDLYIDLQACHDNPNVRQHVEKLISNPSRGDITIMVIMSCIVQ